MPGYITGFAVYTLAMIGVIFVALIVVKKSLSFSSKSKDNFLKVESCLNIEPRKNLYVVKAGREKFLISSAGENCQFMTKLEDKNTAEILNQVQEMTQEENLEQVKPLPQVDFVDPIADNIELPRPKRRLSKYFTGAF